MSDVTIPSEASPAAVAARLVGVHGDDGDWLDHFAEILDRGRSGHALDRVMRVWNLNLTEVGALFGITRQAVSKWVEHGPPVERVSAIAEVAAATDLLVHHLKRDRIPAVVRRAAPALRGRSLIDLWAAGDTRRLLDATRAMFSFGDAHA